MFDQKCKNVVTDEGSPSLQRYCYLPIGHSGKCNPNPPPANYVNKPERCDSLSPTNRSCGLPKGHSGSHSRADGHATAELW